MGLVKKILSLKIIDKVSTFYSNHLAIELAENFHIHFRNLRIELDEDEFDAFCISVRKAHFKWRLIGKPPIGDIDNIGEQIVLSKSRIPSEPGKKNPAVNSNEIRVELQKWADYIHLHWKWSRLEFTIDEFYEFADAIKNSIDTLKSEFDLSTMPKRIGKNHVACPRDRVDKLEECAYWISKDQDIHLENRHKTFFFDKKDQQKKEYLKSHEHIKTLNINISFYNRIILKVLKKIRLLAGFIGIQIK